MKWFRKAAEQGCDESQFYLGLMYALGKGVPRDDVLAYMWFNISDANGLGLGRGESIRDILEVILTPEQLAEAQRLSRKWFQHKGDNQ